MSQISQLKENLNETGMMEFITNIFTEVNSIKARNIRTGFEKNRRFFQEITAVYHDVKLAAALRGVNKNLVRNETTTAIAITSNLRFYGNLNLQVMERFVSDNSLNTGSRDLIVVGETGLEFLSAKKMPMEVQPLRFKKDFPQPEEINFLINKTKTYDRVYLYYPKFINMIQQTVDVVDITQTVELQEIAKVRSGRQNIDIFEPEVEEILAFFETQVRTLLLIRTFLETELSRTAARLLSMSSAKQRAQEMIQQQKIQFNKAKNSLENAKILETFAGMKNWQTV